ncbi:hypothetical protein RDABS01_023221 [Bienertia sinuspersici]
MADKQKEISSSIQNEDLKKKGKMDVDWAELQEELLIRIIENHLVSMEDYLAFSGVCSSWHNATLCCSLAKLKQNWARQMPWLMLTDGNQETFGTENGEEITLYEPGELGFVEDSSCSTRRYVFDDLYRRSMVNLRQGKSKWYDLKCRQGYGRTCWGSAHGWVVAHGLDHKMYLFNPITKSRLDLPSRRTLPYLWNNSPKFVRSSFISRAVVLRVPNGKRMSLLVVLIYDLERHVALAKPGDRHWIEIGDLVSFPMDVVYHRDMDGDRDRDRYVLLLVNDMGNLGYYDLQSLSLEEPLKFTWYGCKVDYMLDEHRGRFSEHVYHRTYLVNSGEDLLMIIRMIELDDIISDVVFGAHNSDIHIYNTVEFMVYKFQFKDNVWEELHDLQDVAIFVGNNATISVCASDAGCQRNCIYFTDDYRRGYSATENGLGGHDMGVFRMDDKSIVPLDMDGMNNARSSYCCPLWFNPSLQFFS